MPWLGLRSPRCIAALAVLLLLALAGCVDDSPRAVRPGEPLRVVATTNIVADLAREIGGDDVAVTALMRPGIDPHQYKASAGDVRRLGEANLIVYGGLELEGKMESVFEELGRRVPSVAVSEGIPAGRLIPVAGTAGEFDPHVWNDPMIWAQAGRTLADALAEADPANSADYRARAEAYAARLARLRDDLRADLAPIPARQRVLVTSHDAFSYFGRAFGFEVEGIQGVSTATEVSTADVARVAGLVADRGLPAIFLESSVPPQTVEAVLADARSRGREARVGGELYSDSAGDEGTPQASYEGMMRHNVAVIRDGLLGGG